ncbi:MAG: hypothetical protein IIA40_04450 [SAR324 cluster bacterium]|nr:hypothetical protein [SAR324 cluster bacterium]
MIEREILLNSATAILLACLLWHHGAISRRYGRTGFLLVVIGSLIPLLDPAVYHVLAEDRIDFLTRPPRFAAPMFGVLLIVSVGVLAAFVTGARRAAQLALGLTAGYALYTLLALLTPVGAPLMAPLWARRVALALLPAGHPAILLLLFAALLSMECAPRWKRWLWPSSTALLVLYGLAGGAHYGLVTHRAAVLDSRSGHTWVYPENIWLTRWQSVRTSGEQYELRHYGLGGAAISEPEVLPRWNDEALFLKLLGDPVVFRFYFHVFRHPVVRLDTSGTQITLLMQELTDQLPLVPGRTFYLEGDLSGRNRFYQLQRFH